jgi:hypothetical protein
MLPPQLNLSAALKRDWPLVAAVGTYWLEVAAIVVISIGRNQGHLIYGLDDTYIHMAIARNAALHHVWGVTKFAFTSSTSSPLWTLLLTGTYLVLGVNNWSPLVLNLLFGTILLVSVYVILMKYLGRTSRWLTFFILLTVVTAATLPWMTVVGMEHVLHALLTLSFVFLAAGYLASVPEDTKKGRVLLLVVAPLLTMTRYEGLFAVFVVCVLLLSRRRILFAAALGVLALVPPVVYGVWSVSRGWFFFPNSLLLKGQRPDFHSLGGVANLLGWRALTVIWHNPHIMVLLGASLLQLAYLRFKKRTALDSARTCASLAFIGALLLHVQFANTGWYYRYESYLLVLGTVTLGVSMSDLLSTVRSWNLSRRARLRFAPAVPLLMALGAPLYFAAYRSVVAPQAMTNIYEQQYQTGLFLKRFYSGRAVAVNDIGAVCYLADIHLLDLSGLGTVETSRLLLRGCFSTREIQSLAETRHVTVGIVYDRLLRDFGGQPPPWTDIGQWKIAHNVVCAGNIVTLYAADPSAAAELARNLRAFAPDLPPDDMQSGTYVESDTTSSRH